MIGWYGTAMLWLRHAQEHLGLPDKNDVKDGIIAYKIAAHAADLAKGHQGAQLRDKRAVQGPLRVPLGRPVQPRARSGQGEAISRPRRSLRKAPSSRTSVRLCGPHFCSMKITQDVRDYAAGLGVSESEALQKG